jgi:hypothetical protein
VLVPSAVLLVALLLHWVDKPHWATSSQLLLLLQTGPMHLQACLSD